MLRKILAVVAVVMGVVAGVSAQGTLPSNTPGKEIAGQTGTMGISYTVTSHATMSVYDEGMSGDELLAAPSTGAPGNLGYIDVSTSYPYWDVTMKAANGGKLLTQGTAANGWASDTLKNAVTTANDRYMGLAVIFALRPANGAPGPNLGTSAVIDTGAAATGSVLKNPAGVSIAEVIGTALAATEFLGRPGTGTNSISTHGFPSTDHTLNTASDGFVRIYVNGGIGRSGVTGAPVTVGGNPDGVYTETLTFTLFASY